MGDVVEFGAWLSQVDLGHRHEIVIFSIFEEPHLSFLNLRDQN